MRAVRLPLTRLRFCLVRPPLSSSALCLMSLLVQHRPSSSQPSHLAAPTHKMEIDDSSAQRGAAATAVPSHSTSIPARIDAARVHKPRTDVLSSLFHRSMRFDSHRRVDPESWLLRDLACGNDDVHSMRSIFADLPAMSFCLRYHPNALNGSLMAVEGSSNAGSLIASCDESGWVSFLHSNTPAHEQGFQVRHRFRAHRNAIFDMAWLENTAATHSGHIASPAERTGSVTHQMVTASGDQTARGWDITTGTCLFTLKGHKGSVKTIRPQPGQPSQCSRRVQRCALIGVVLLQLTVACAVRFAQTYW